MGAGLAALASAAPLEERASSNYFAVSNFVYGCTVTCDYSFSVSVVGDQAEHPSVDTPVTCSGHSGTQKFKKCGRVSDTQSIYAYIDKDSKLQLDYEYHDVKAGATYNYYGHQHVNTATSGKPQRKNFKVKESSATGVA